MAPCLKTPKHVVSDRPCLTDVRYGMRHDNNRPPKKPEEIVYGGEHPGHQLLWELTSQVIR